MPERVLFTRDALAERWGRQIFGRVTALGLPAEALRGNRLPSVAGDDPRATYRAAKRTLAVVNAPAGQLKLAPIPPSADWQFHLAQGCPAHCHYCYLAGSLAGPPLVRAYGNLDAILGNLAGYVGRPTGARAAAEWGGDGAGLDGGALTTFEASCYTDPLALEHLTGSLGEAVVRFGTDPALERARLRWTTKFSSPALVAPLLGLPHAGRTRCRVSLNADPVARRFEGGTAPVAERLAGAAQLAAAGYPVGLVLAPIMPVEGWEAEYGALLDAARAALPPEALAPRTRLTVECITHRYTEGSRGVLRGWYPNTALEMDDAKRTAKRTKFGNAKYVYPRDVMAELKGWFAAAVRERWPEAGWLYWT
ncbi:spore photoproduct lyase [Gemmatimonadetes bacterium T265]|nr:spore photoproduct lyase [Gemmatimonadetes bacterium T265]